MLKMTVYKKNIKKKISIGWYSWKLNIFFNLLFSEKFIEKTWNNKKNKPKTKLGRKLYVKTFSYIIT